MTAMSFDPHFCTNTSKTMDALEAERILTVEGLARAGLRAAAAEAIRLCDEVGLIDGSEAGALYTLMSEVSDALMARINVGRLHEAEQVLS
jgi:2-hydroxychromene-2-carboxylate isomerase